MEIKKNFINIDIWLCKFDLKIKKGLTSLINCDKFNINYAVK